MSALLPDGLPAIETLKARPQWVALRSKVPVNTHTGRNASVSEPASWCSFDTAEAFAVDHELGLGIVLSGDGLVGIDLDDCVGEDGSPEKWVTDVLALAETYAELSPSGRGVRLFALGSIPKAATCNPAHVEIYGTARCLSVTGRHLPGTPTAIHPAPKTLAALLARIASYKKPRQAPPKTGGNNFFRAVNELALAKLDGWFPVLFPSARYSAGGVWRVSPESISGHEGLEEDLSASPDGIVDFGIADMGDSRDGRRTPIDLTIEHGNAGNAVQAALWLCEHLGRSPESLGWKGPTNSGKTNGAAHTAESNQAEPLDLLGAPELVGWPELTEDCLPEAVYRYVMVEAGRLTVDPCPLAAHVLAACSASISDAWSIRPKQHDHWTQQARIWTCVVKDVGERGTEMIRTAFWPIEKRDQEQRQQWRAEHAAWEARQPEKKTKQLAKDDPEPHCPRLITNDATIEVLSEILSHGGDYEKIALRCDELVSFFGSFGRYADRGGSAPRALMLEAYDGGPQRIDRIKRGHVFVPNWSVVVAGNIQPRRLAGMAKDLVDDGLFQRFLVVHTRPRPPGMPDDRPLSVSAGSDYHKLHDALASLMPATGDMQPFPAYVDPDGHAEREGFMRLLDRLRIDESLPSLIRESSAKWSGLLARLSLIFHLVGIATRKVEGEEIEDRDLYCVRGKTVARAGTFLRRIALPNLFRLGYETLSDDGSAATHTRWVAGHILAHPIETITARDIGRAYRPLRSKPLEIVQAMSVLVHAGWASLQAQTRHDSVVWTINPHIYLRFEKAAAAERQRREAVLQMLKTKIGDP